nr:MAG: hypothetical protein KatS3mg041_0994 [Bacteroidota bacterium]
MRAVKRLGQVARERRGRARDFPLKTLRGLGEMIDRARAEERFYEARLGIGFVGALVLVLFVLHLPWSPGSSYVFREAPPGEVVSIEQVEQTLQPERPPAPPVPLVPVSVPDDKLLDEEEVQIMSSELRVGEATAVDRLSPPEAAPPPPPVESSSRAEEPEVFVVVEEPPEIIGGVERLQQLIRYPELARKAGIEGLVIVEVLVDPEGRPHNPQIIKRAGGGLDEAAVEAVMQLTFKPGRQRGKPVWVRFAIPVRFRLRDVPTPPTR